jgi:hypothetical protein
MIRFICKNCQGFVQVAELFAGKQGRCPFCKELVRVPAQSDPLAKNTNGQAGNIEEPATDDLRALKAAVLKEELPQPTKAVPPPPQTLQNTEDIQLNLDQDPSDGTADMPAIQPVRPTLVQPEMQARTHRRLRPQPQRFGLTWLIFAIGIVVVVAAIIMVLMVARKP